MGIIHPVHAAILKLVLLSIIITLTREELEVMILVVAMYTYIAK